MPPPPPPPPVISAPVKEATAIAPEIQSQKSPPDNQQSVENSGSSCTAVLAPSQFPPATATPPYYVHPPIQTQSSTPWWVPNEADSSELYESQYAQWYEATYKVPPPANLASNAKSKYYKRKSEFIDPAQDAGKLYRLFDSVRMSYRIINITV